MTGTNHFDEDLILRSVKLSRCKETIFQIIMYFIKDAKGLHSTAFSSIEIFVTLSRLALPL